VWNASEASVTEASDLPLVDESRIKSVFADLEKMEVDLDDDPLEFGPKRLIEKVAHVRRMLNQCERIFLQVSHDLHCYKRTSRAAQLDFDLQMQDLLANDPEVRAGRNVRDRDAIGTMKLRSQREKIMSLDVGIQDLEMIMTVVKAKRADLRDLQGRIRDQIKLCQEEIGLGSRWGSRPVPGMKPVDLDAAPRTDPDALADIQNLIASTGGEAVGEVHLADADVDEALILKELEASLATDEDEDSEEVEPPVAAKVDPPVPAPVIVQPTSEDPDSFPTVDEESEEVAKVEKTNGSDEISLDSILDLTDKPEPEKPPMEIPPVASDESVDSFFSNLTAGDVPKIEKKGTPEVLADENLDSLIDMFGG
jgi:hypothetical protein